MKQGNIKVITHKGGILYNTCTCFSNLNSKENSKQGGTNQEDENKQDTGELVQGPL